MKPETLIMSLRSASPYEIKIVGFVSHGTAAMMQGFVGTGLVVQSVSLFPPEPGTASGIFMEVDLHPAEHHVHATMPEKDPSACPTETVWFSHIEVSGWHVVTCSVSPVNAPGYVYQMKFTSEFVASEGKAFAEKITLDTAKKWQKRNKS